MKRCGIYLITHIETGRKYVGQSIDIERRWRDHAKGKSGSGILGHAVAKHGWEAFEASVLQICAHDELNEVEPKWIEAMGSLHPNGFNLTTGGKQFKVTDEVRRIISERTRAFMTPEWIAKRAAAQRGIPKSDEWKAKMSARQSQPDNIARITALARNQTAETREKIGAGNRGKKRTDAVKAHLSEIKRTPENIERLAFYSKNPSPEMRAKMSASAKARCARQREQKEAMKVAAQPTLPGI